MKHLNEDYERRGSGHSTDSFIGHLYDTISLLGGIKGLFIIGFFAMLAYAYILYTITSSREKRRLSTLAKKQ
jgi:hypothetical protein